MPMYAEEIKGPCAGEQEELEKAWAEIERLRKIETAAKTLIACWEIKTSCVTHTRESAFNLLRTATSGKGDSENG